MPRKVSLPPHLIGASFRISDAALHGVTRARLRGADVTHPFQGIGAVGLDLSTTYGRCLAFEPRLAAGHYFSHRTAADLYGFPLSATGGDELRIARPGDVARAPLHISVLGRRTPPEGRGVVGHALTASDVGTRLVMGLPVVDPADTWCHLAALLSREDLAAVGDFLISGRPRGGGRREPPLATIEQLTIAVERHSGRRGAKALRWALPRLRTGVDSRPETLTRLLLVAAGLPEPVVNLPVDVGAGLILHPDLSYANGRVALEYEGEEHRTSVKRFRSDIERRELFESAGWRVIRVTADDLFVFPERFIARVRRILRERGALHPTF